MKRISLTFTGCPHSIRRRVRAAQLAEKCGYEMVWSAEDYDTGRDGITPLACYALSTDRIRLGTCVINPYTRSPGLLAATMATLDELSNGRMVLGLGAGLDWASVYPVGVGEIRHLETMRETIQLVRRLFSDRTATYHGKALTLGDPFLWPDEVIRPLRDRIPIYVGARGPRMEGLAAEVSDGLIFEVEVAVPIVQRRIEHFLERVERAGRNPDDVDLVGLIPVSVSEDGELDEATRRYTAYATARSDDRTAKLLGIDEEETTRVKEAFKKGGLKEACMYISENTVDIYTAWGPAEKCIRKIREYVAAGVKLPAILPVGGDIELAIKAGERYAGETL